MARLPDDPLNPKNPPAPRKRPQYIPKPPDQKVEGKSGRPLKYERILVVDANGKEQIVSKEIDKKRYWFVAYIFVMFEKTHYASITFETRKNMIFSMHDVCNLVGNRNLTITWFHEFIDYADYKEFSRREQLEVQGLELLQL